MQTESKRSCKVYVSVKVDFDANGRMFPRSLLWEDGHEYEIDRVLDVRVNSVLKMPKNGGEKV